MATLEFPPELEEAFQSVFESEQIRPWQQPEDNPVDDHCLVGQDGKVFVVPVGT